MKVEIKNKDCLEGMRELKDNSVDCILTDPPYSGNSCSGKEGGRFANFHIEFNDLSERAFYKFIRPRFYEMYKKLKMGGHIYIFCDWKQLRNMMDEIELASFKLINLVVWDKGHFGMGAGYRRQEEYIIVASKGSANTFNSKSYGSVLKHSRVHKNKRNHPHEKPRELLEIFIKNSTNETDTVLDCFLGGGSSAVACKSLNRNFIGFEINKKYCECAIEKVRKNKK